MFVWNQWIAEGHTERYTRPLMTNDEEERQIGRSALQNRTTTSQIISQEMITFASRPVSSRTVRLHLKQREQRLTKLDTGVAKCLFSDEFRFCVQYFGGRIRDSRLVKECSSSACI